MGINAFTLEDDIFLVPSDVISRSAIERHRPMVEGDGVRDWSAAIPTAAVFPYENDFAACPPNPRSNRWRHLWRGRALLAQNVMFGQKTKVEAGLPWYEFGRLTSSKLKSPLTITFAFVATHNHFVLDRGGTVFKQSAPVIKLPHGASEEDHLALLGVLNSSVACFWLKQVWHNKGSTVDSHGARQRTAPFEDFFEFNATKVKDFPFRPRSPYSRSRPSTDLPRTARLF